MAVSIAFLVEGFSTFLAWSLIIVVGLVNSKATQEPQAQTT